MIKIFLLLLLSISLWANIGNIMAIKGSAEVKRSSEMLNATNGMQILEGDTIVTQLKARVQVMLKDETVVTIGSNSSFGFEEFLLDNESNSKLTMSAQRGFFRSVTGKLGKIAPERFKVKTASATIGIRGTDFSGEIGEDFELFKCYRGKIYVLHAEGQQDIPEGQMLRLGGDKKEVQKIPGYKKEFKREADRVGDDMDRVNIPTEDIADVTQAPDTVHEDYQDFNDYQPTPSEPFDVVPNSEDRQTNY